MHYGFRLVEQLASGLEGWMLEKGFAKVSDFVGRSLPRLKTWGELDLNYKTVAEIDQKKCVHCGLCYVACEDGAHQSIRREAVPVAEYVRANGHAAQVVRSGGVEVLAGAGGDTINVYTVKRDSCVGCNLCSLVCPVEGCVTMRAVETGKPAMSWNEYQARLAAGTVEKIGPPEHV
jgi:dihydropyrimidine dehydrogenase (NAD+) subunit PreA